MSLPRLVMMLPRDFDESGGPVRTKIRLFILAVFTSALVACGAASDDAYTPTTDTVSTTGLITLSSDEISIVTKGPTVQSEIIDECTIGFEAENLSYSFTTNDELILDGQTFEYVRPLTTPSAKAGIDERLFAVWKTPSATVGQVTYTFEVEIHADTIIYRNTCVR